MWKGSRGTEDQLCQTTASPQSPPTQSPSRWLGGGDRNPLLECASLPHPPPLPKPEVIRLQHQGFHASLRHICRMEQLRSSRQGREVKQVGHWPLCDFEHTGLWVRVDPTTCTCYVHGGNVLQDLSLRHLAGTLCPLCTETRKEACLRGSLLLERSCYMKVAL